MNFTQEPQQQTTRGKFNEGVGSLKAQGDAIAANDKVKAGVAAVNKAKDKFLGMLTSRKTKPETQLPEPETYSGMGGKRRRKSRRKKRTKRRRKSRRKKRRTKRRRKSRRKRRR